MNNKTSIFFITIGLFLGAIFFTSCDDRGPQDPDFVFAGDVSKYVPSYAFSLTCTSSYSGKNFDLTAQPHAYFDLSEWGMRIEKVDYYVDGEFIESQSISPYEFKYHSSNWTPTAHKVLALLTICGANINTFKMPIERVFDNSSTGSKSVDVYFDYNYVKSGDTFEITAGINPERSAANSRITSFTATWDNEEIGKCNNSPYKLTRHITEAGGTTHSFSASMSYTAGGANSTQSFSFSYANYKICGSTDAMFGYTILSRYRDYRNGERLKGIARLCLGDLVSDHYSFNLLLDGVVIATSSTFPYSHEYQLKGLSIGEHKLTKKWIVSNNNGKVLYTTSSDESIYIVE